jgi:predicted anti-sigma-YlaC factor YlaD
MPADAVRARPKASVFAGDGQVKKRYKSQIRRVRMKKIFRGCVIVYSICALSSAGCSVRRMAINSLGNALSKSSSTFVRDDDPELVRDAVPFALKAIESLIEQAPKHRGLLAAACSGFTEYAYVFVQQEADFIEARDLGMATDLRARAKKLYLRALDYGMRGIEVDFPGFRNRLRKDPDAALAAMAKKHVPMLYWTSSAWAAAFAIDKADSELSVDQSLMEKMMRRALVLDEGWEMGEIHDFLISWEGGHASTGGSYEKARHHFERAVALSKGLRAAPYVSFAEVVSVGTQNRKEFQEVLNAALKVDINQAPDQRLANIVMQRRARWLLAHVDELFAE